MTDCKPNRITSSASRRAFTLIELLVVIAIISILIALLFPVFSSVMENSRESNSMSNMQQIQSALALYKLDNQKYPDVLFAYAPVASDNCKNASGLPPRMSELGSASGSDCSGKFLVGLYPTYISDWHVFTNADNQVDDTSLTVSANVNTFPSTNGRSMQNGVTAKSFYAMDAYDVSPQITGVNATTAPSDTSHYVVRYQTSWTDYTPLQSSSGTGTGTTTTYSTLCFPNGDWDSTNNVCNQSDYDPDYARQLRWTSPPPNTYVTSTTDHIQNANRVLVLYLDGTVKKINFQDGWQNSPTGMSSTGFAPSQALYQQLEQSYTDSQPDVSAVAVGGGGGTGGSGAYESQAGFWRTLVGRGEQ